MKLFFFIFVTISYFELFAQMPENLVINGDFEILANDSCVRTANFTVGEFKGWFDHAVRSESSNGELGRTSPDSYHLDTCGRDVSWNNSIPVNTGGFQYPKSGNGYAGFVFHQSREFISGSLNKPTDIDLFYCVKIHLSVAEVSTVASKGLQVVFHTDSTLLVIPFTPTPGGMILNFQKELDKLSPITFLSDFISDTAAWITLEASFKADSNYRFFTIGNFNSLHNTDFIPLRPNDIGRAPLAYFFLDDVSIYDCSDTIPPPEPTFAFEVKAYPNPASDWFNFDYTLPEAGKVRIHVTDVFGKIVLARTELQGQKGVNTFAIDATPWAMGRYHISVLYEANGRSEYRHLKHQIIR